MGVNNKFVFICILAILVFSVSVIAEPIIYFELIIFKNDTVEEHYVRQSEGVTSIYNPGGDYNLKVLDKLGNEVLNQTFEIEFDFMGLAAESTSFWHRIPYNSNTYELKFYHGEKLIFSKVLNFCNGDSVCDHTSETFETCPQDCPLDHNDDICIAEEDGLCDPDCGEDVDPDCNGKFYPYAGPNAEVEVGKLLKFKGEVKNASKDTYTYEWSIEAFGHTETGRKITYKFDEEGVFAVDLTVTNQDGVYKKDTLMVTVAKKKIVKETKPFFTKITLLILLVVALLGAGLLVGFFFKKLKEIIGRRLKISIIILILILLIVLGLLFFIGKGVEYRPVEYYSENYCEKDSDCVGVCDDCRSIFKGPASKATSQALIGYTSVCLGITCVCENNQCEPYNTENISVEYCERREDSPKKLKSSCYKNLANKSNDISFCDSVEDHDINLQCKEELMEESVTVEFCRLYSDRSKTDTCLISLAWRLNNRDICNEVEVEISKEVCLIKFAISINDCEKLKDRRTNCYWELAEKLKDVSFCDKIEAKSSREPCIDKFATSIDNCDKIETDWLKERCTSKFQGG